jgi:hypothetical protein
MATKVMKGARNRFFKYSPMISGIENMNAYC